MARDATMMTLCEICDAIPFGDVLTARSNRPREPMREEASLRSIWGLPPWESDHTGEIFRHYGSMDELTSSALNCPICKALRAGFNSDYEPTYDAPEQGSQVWVYLDPSTRGADVSKPAHAMLRCIIWSPKTRAGTQMKYTSAVSICEENSLEQPRRLIPPDPASEKGLLQMTTWINQCTQGHLRCNYFDANNAQHPARILDVGNSHTDLVKLKGFTELNRKYVALSHCWGPEKNLQTTSKSLEAHRHGIPVDTLPRTFRDAVFVTRRLGLRYLWIDSLCIIQGDEEDWKREASAMASIYSNAYLTIAASNSSSDQNGFLRVRNTAPLNTAKFKTRNGMSGSLSLTDPTWAPKGDNPHKGYVPEDPLQCEPLSARAWALQERYLSRRILFFGTWQMMWECTELSETESGSRFEDRHHHLSLSLFKSSISYLSESPSWRLHACWYEIVQRYSACQMTKKTDRIPAISGIARKVGEKLWQAYCCGIWEGSLETGLLWSIATESMPAAVTSSHAGRRRPSWSWTSLDCGVTFALLKYHSLSQAAPGNHLESQGYESLLFSHRYDSVFDGDNRYGPIRNATLEILAPIVKLVTPGAWEDAKKNKYSVSTQYDQHSNRKTDNCYIAFLAVSREQLFGLIVEPFCAHYRRVGIASGRLQAATALQPV